jgi:hypothetical protein
MPGEAISPSIQKVSMLYLSTADKTRTLRLADRLNGQCRLPASDLEGSRAIPMISSTPYFPAQLTKSSVEVQTDVTPAP